MTREDVQAVVERALAEAPRPRRPARAQVSELAVVRFIFQLLGIGVFCVGCGILLAVLSGYKRPIRALGITPDLETALGVVVLGAFAVWMSLQSGQVQARPSPPQQPVPTPPPSTKHCSICAEELLVDAEMCANCDEPQWLM